MPSIVYRILAVVVTVALVGGLGAVAVQQYSAKTVAQAAVESVKDAVSEAVHERKEAVKVDVAQTVQRAATARKTQAVLISHRETSKEVLNVQIPDCRDADADRLRVFLDAAREVNRVLDSTTSVH